jgi:HSP20 family molecular chaperone IbpA
MIRKRCKNCNEKLKKSYSFCPSCGSQIKRDNRDYGLLGKSDFGGKEKGNFLGNFSDKMMMKMLGSAIKMLEKEFEKEIDPKDKKPSPKLKLMINGKEIFNNSNKAQNKKNSKDENLKKLPIEFSKENLKKWANLNKKEPKTNLKRIDEKIFYELDVPGVESIKDISIINLENSLEVRALAKKEAYLKNIPIDLPLAKYTLFNGKLVLEISTN